LMAFLRRNRQQPESLPADETLMGDELVAVPEDEVARYGEAITEAVSALYPGDVSEAEVKRYQTAILMIVNDLPRLQSMPEQAFASAQSIARFGYLTRQIEVDRFGPFDHGQPGFPELLMKCLRETDDEDPVSAVCVSWSLQEPEHPRPEEPSLLWLIPGLGGHIRDALSENAVVSLTPEEGLPDGISFSELKKCWRFGFFYRCCEEVIAASPEFD
jgi:hypothetical protein